MEKKIPKGILISLIRDDLKHQHLIWGLNMLGPKCEDLLLDIPQTVFFLMGLNTSDRRLEHLVDEYSDRAYKVTDMSVKDVESFRHLSVEIYNWLTSERRRYRKALTRGTR